MQAAPTAARPPLAARLYGVRLLYVPEARERFAFVILFFCAVYYAAQAVIEYAGLGKKLLDFDFGQFRQAALDLDVGRDPYRVFIGLKCTAWCLGGYVYSPLLAEIIRPLDALRERVAAGVWIGVTHALLLASLGLLVWGLRRNVSTATMATLLAAGLVFQPVFDNLAYMQVGALILFLMVVAALFYMRDLPRSSTCAGALIALGAVLKVTPVTAAPVVLPPGWLRAQGVNKERALREAGAGIAGLVGGGLAIVGGLLLLVPHTYEFFTYVLPHLARGTTGWENKSMVAFVARTLEQLGQPYSSTLIGVGVILAFLGPVVVLTACVAPQLAARPPVRAAVFAAYIATLPIVSTITWHHHLTVSLLAIFLLAPSLWPGSGAPGVSRAGKWLLAASYPLMYVEEIFIQQFTLKTGIVHPSTLDVIRGTVLENANLWGMLALWLAAVLVVLAAVRGSAVGAPAEPSPSLAAGAAMASAT